MPDYVEKSYASGKDGWHSDHEGHGKRFLTRRVIEPSVDRCLQVGHLRHHLQKLSGRMACGGRVRLGAIGDVDRHSGYCEGGTECSTLFLLPGWGFHVGVLARD
jgi:hypothetical protein